MHDFKIDISDYLNEWFSVEGDLDDFLFFSEPSWSNLNNFPDTYPENTK